MSPGDPAGGAVDRQLRGRLGEEAAVTLLRRRGYAIVERNVRCGRLELDIVAREGGCLVFVEVKARWSDRFGAPEEAVTQRKRRNLVRAAHAYLEQRGLAAGPWRIDVLALRLAGGRVLSHELFQDAIEEEGE